MNVLILDDTLTQVSVITNILSLKYIRSYDNKGAFELQVNLNQKNAADLEVGKFIYIDSQRCAVIETLESARTENKENEIITASGVEIKDLLLRRLAEVPAEDRYVEYVQEYTEDIVRDLLDNNLINPTDAKRKIDFLQMGSSGSLGQQIDYTIYNLNLETYIYGYFLPLDELGLKCDVNLSNKTATYSVYKGIDRTTSQEVNPPAVFSLKLGTSKSNTVVKDVTSMKNLIYVWNGLYGTSELVETVYSNTEPEGVDRFEASVKDTDAATSQDLVTSGEIALKNNELAISVTGVAGMGEPDYDLGDKVTFVDYKSGESMDLRIKQIYYYYTIGETEIKQLTFGAAPMSIAKAFSNQFTPLNKEYAK